MAAQLDKLFDPEVEGASKTLTRSIDRLSNSMFSLFDSIAKVTGAESLFRGFIDTLREFAETFNALIDPTPSQSFDAAATLLRRRLESQNLSGVMDDEGRIDLERLGKLRAQRPGGISNIFNEPADKAIAKQLRAMQDAADAIDEMADGAQAFASITAETENTIRMIAKIIK